MTPTRQFGPDPPRDLHYQLAVWPSWKRQAPTTTCSCSCWSWPSWPHSRIGWAWQAIREDELAARAMGINTTVAKLQAFTESINILAMVIVGGLGSLLGVVVGAAIIVALPEIFRELQLYRLLVSS